MIKQLDHCTTRYTFDNGYSILAQIQGDAVHASVWYTKTQKVDYIPGKLGADGFAQLMNTIQKRNSIK